MITVIVDGKSGTWDATTHNAKQPTFRHPDSEHLVENLGKESRVPFEKYHQSPCEAASARLRRPAAITAPHSRAACGRLRIPRTSQTSRQALELREPCSQPSARRLPCNRAFWNAVQVLSPLPSPRYAQRQGREITPSRHRLHVLPCKPLVWQERQL